MTCGAGLTLLGRGGRELSGSGAACVVDPYYSGDPTGETLLLVHGDGVDGAQVFTDSSSHARTFTVVGTGVVTETDSEAFNGSSIRNALDASYIIATLSTPIGVADLFTLEFFIQIIAGVGIPGSYGSGGRGAVIRCLIASAVRLEFCGALSGATQHVVGYRSDFGFMTDAGASLQGSKTNAERCHIAVTRETPGQIKVWADGFLARTLNTSEVQFDRIAVGNQSGYLASITGARIEELRVTRGVARYTATFTPPTLPYCSSSLPSYEIDPPPTTIPPGTYTDSQWASVRFLSAMDLTKVNLKTSVAYTQDSAAVTATDPFDGAGALACVYPPESPTSTPFSPVELATLTLRGASGSCVEMWVRLDAWTAWTSGAYKWANLVQQDDLGGDPAWAVGIADELADGVVTPCLQLFSHYIDRRSYLEIWRRTWARAAFPVDGQWHHLAVDFRSYSGFVTTIVVYLDGAAIAALTAPDYTVGQTLQFAGQTTFDIVEGTGIYTTPAGLSSTTFDGALDEVRVTEASRYPSNFTVPHYAFPRS